MEPYLEESEESKIGISYDFNLSDVFKNNTNNSENNFYPDFTQILAVNIFFIILYILVMALTIIGNSMVCWTVFRHKKMQTVVNYYIVNLAVSDLMVGMFVMPLKLLELTAPMEWNILNDGICTLLSYLQSIIVFVSVLTLVATSIERYKAIVFPLEARQSNTKSRARKILCSTWIIPCIVASPFLKRSNATDNVLSSEYGTIRRVVCITEYPYLFREVYYIFLFVFVYLIPLLFITITCIRIIKSLLATNPKLQRRGTVRRQEENRRKVAKMVIVVVIAFALAWTPYFLITITTQIQQMTFETNFFDNGNFIFIMLCINLLAFTNSCVNPFIYTVMSIKFRNSFKKIARDLTCGLLTFGLEPPVREVNSQVLTTASQQSSDESSTGDYPNNPSPVSSLIRLQSFNQPPLKRSVNSTSQHDRSLRHSTITQFSRQSSLDRNSNDSGQKRYISSDDNTLRHDSLPKISDFHKCGVGEVSRILDIIARKTVGLDRSLLNLPSQTSNKGVLRVLSLSDSTLNYKNNGFELKVISDKISNDNEMDKSRISWKLPNISETQPVSYLKNTDWNSQNNTEESFCRDNSDEFIKNHQIKTSLNVDKLYNSEC